jgi:hypothetical protein
LLTFHKIIAGCLEGSREAWREFLSGYSPVMIRLAGIYLANQRNPEQTWQEILGPLWTENFKQLRGIERQSEPEFLAGLRSFVLDHALERADPLSVPNSVELSPASVHDLLKDLPLLHQEILFLELAGYSEATLDAILRIAPAMAQKSAERLPAELQPDLRRDTDACPFPAAWLQLLKQVRAERSEACVSLRQFLRIQDGQAGWYDKEQAVAHLAGCLHCLEAWTGLREIKYLRAAAPPLPAQELENLLSQLPVRQEHKTSRPLFKRIFG